MDLTLLLSIKPLLTDKSSLESNACKSNVALGINVFSDPTPVSERYKIAVGTAGLLLGLVFLLTGLIYYKKNTSGETHDQINQKIGPV